MYRDQSPRKSVKDLVKSFDLNVNLNTPVEVRKKHSFNSYNEKPQSVFNRFISQPDSTSVDSQKVKSINRLIFSYEGSKLETGKSYTPINDVGHKNDKTKVGSHTLSGSNYALVKSSALDKNVDTPIRAKKKFDFPEKSQIVSNRSVPNTAIPPKKSGLSSLERLISSYGENNNLEIGKSYTQTSEVGHKHVETKVNNHIFNGANNALGKSSALNKNIDTPIRAKKKFDFPEKPLTAYNRHVSVPNTVVPPKKSNMGSLNRLVVSHEENNTLESGEPYTQTSEVRLPNVKNIINSPIFSDVNNVNVSSTDPKNLPKSPSQFRKRGSLTKRRSKHLGGREEVKSPPNEERHQNSIIKCRWGSEYKICEWRGTQDELKAHYKQDHVDSHHPIDSRYVKLTSMESIQDTVHLRLFDKNIFWYSQKIVEGNKKTIHIAIQAEVAQDDYYYEIALCLKCKKLKRMILEENCLNVNEDFDSIIRYRKCVIIPLQVITSYFDISDNNLDQVQCRVTIRRRHERV